MNPIIRHSLAFFILMSFQLVFFNHITLYNIATPFVFLLFILMLPLSLPIPVLYGIAFATGLIADIFTDHYVSGLHTFSVLAMASLRAPLLSITTTSSFSKSINELSIKDQDFLWYIAYLGPLIFIHHFCYFFLEAFTFSTFGFTFLKVLGSSIYTFLITMTITIIFYKR